MNMQQNYHPNTQFSNNNHQQNYRMDMNFCNLNQNQGIYQQYGSDINKQVLVNSFICKEYSDQNSQLSGQQHSIYSPDSLSTSDGNASSRTGSNGENEFKFEDIKKDINCAKLEQIDDDDMEINDEDYTNSSYQYPIIDEEQEKIEEEENQKIIEREKVQSSFIFSSESNDSYNTQQYCYIPLNKILLEHNEFYLYGDMIVESRYSHKDEKNLNSYCNWKHIYQSQRRDNYVQISSNNKSQSSENFNQVVQFLRSFQNQNFYEITQLLDSFSKMYQYLKQGLKKNSEYIEIFDKFKYLQKRKQIFDQMTDEFLKKIPSDKIFFCVQSEPNFSNLQLENSQICFSNALLKLVNLEQDQFINLTLRGKSPEFFGHKTRLLFFKNKLQKLLRMQESDYEEIDLLTRDGLRIPARVTKETIKFDIDSLVPELPIAPFSEMIVIYLFEIEQNTLNQIEYMRKNYSVEELNNPEEVDFYTYSLETQAFLELYYSNINPQIAQQKQKKKVEKRNNKNLNMTNSQ